MNRSNPRQNNVPFVQMLSPGNRSALMLFIIIAVNALKIIDREKGLYSSYNSKPIMLKASSNTKIQQL